MPVVKVIGARREEEKPPRWPILAVLLFALFVRLVGIDYGLPYSFNLEEERTVEAGFKMTLIPRASLVGRAEDPTRPVLMSYILAGEYGATFGVGHLFGKWTAVSDYAGHFRGHPTYYYIIARLTSLLFGLITIYLVYMMCVENFEWGIAVMAAAFMAIMPYHVQFSRLATGDMPALALLLGSLRFLLKLARTKWMGDAMMAAALAGFAAAARYEYAVFFLFVLFGYFAVVTRGYRASAVAFGVLGMLICFLFGLILPNAMLLFKARAAAEGAVSAMVSGIGVEALARGGHGLAMLKALVLPQAYWGAVGWMLAGVGLAGLLWGIAFERGDRTRFAIILAALVVPAALLFPIHMGAFPLWALLMSAPLAIGAAFLLYTLFWRTWIPGWLGITLMVLFAAAISLQALALTTVNALRPTEKDTRWQYAVWARQNLPHGAGVFVTAEARYLLPTAVLRGGTEWEMWDAAIMKPFGGRAYNVEMLPLPSDRQFPEPKPAQFAATDSWTIQLLRRATIADPLEPVARKVHGLLAPRQPYISQSARAAEALVIAEGLSARAAPIASFRPARKVSAAEADASAEEGRGPQDPRLVAQLFLDPREARQALGPEIDVYATPQPQKPAPPMQGRPVPSL